MKSSLINGALALAAGVAIGWFAAPTRETSATSDRARNDKILRKLADAGELIDAEQRAMAIKSAFSETTAADMEALVDSVMKLAARRPDMGMREEFLSRWGTLAPRKALAYLGFHSLPSERAAVLTAWGKADPDGAAEGFHPAEKELSEKSQADARALLAGIAEADAVKAIRFADRFALADLTRLENNYTGGGIISPSFEPNGSYQEAIDNWIRRDPEAAFGVMISLKSTQVREQALNELLTYKWPFQNHAAELRLRESVLTDGHPMITFQSKSLWGSLARFLGEDFIAMRWENGTQTPFEAEMLTLATEWTARSLAENGENDEGFAKATAWMEKLPPGNARDAVIRGIVSAWSWLPDQQEKLVKWANALPAAHQKDIAIATFAKKMSREETARALELAATIAEPALRADALAHVAAPFVSKEEGGTMAFDVPKWISQNPEIAESCQRELTRNFILRESRRHSRFVLARMGEFPPNARHETRPLFPYKRPSVGLRRNFSAAISRHAPRQGTLAWSLGRGADSKMKTPLDIQRIAQPVSYADGLAMQENAVTAILSGGVGDTVFLLEHQPVYTIGRLRDRSSLRSAASLPHPVFETNRGGQATYHGPGQLVGYPILDLNPLGRDLHLHLRRIEDALIAASADMGVNAARRPGLTGVWVEDRKLASIGVGVRKWVSMHGFAINVTGESLPPFFAITPCGLDGVSMTCLESETSTPITMQSATTAIAARLREFLA